MIIIDVLFALVVALLCTAIIAAGCRGHREAGLLFGFFILIFLITWAGGIWITPFGPLMWGVPWLSFLLIGILIAVLLAALMPPPREQKVSETQEPAAEIRDVTFINAFLWLFIALVIVGILAGYIID